MQYVFSLAIAICLFSFLSSDAFAQRKFVISGKIPKQYDGVEIKISSENPLFHRYETNAKDGRFHFSGEITGEYEHVNLLVTKDDKVIGGIGFFIRATEMEIEVLHLKAENGRNDFTFRNVPFAADQKKYDDLIKPVEDSLLLYNKQLWLAENKVLTGLNEDSLRAARKWFKSELLSRKIKFIQASSDKYIALYLFNSQIINNTNIGTDSLIAIYSAFDTSLKVTNLGKSVYAHLRGKESLLVNGMPPDLSFSTIDGQQVTLSSFRHKKNVLLCFWASWCGPCIKSIPLLQKIARQYGARDLQLISISIDNEDTKWLNALKKYDMPWLQTCDLPAYIKGGPVRKLYDIHLIPQYFLINREGKLVYHSIQLHDNDDYSILQTKLEKLLQ